MRQPEGTKVTPARGCSKIGEERAYGKFNGESPAPSSFPDFKAPGFCIRSESAHRESSCRMATIIREVQQQAAFSPSWTFLKLVPSRERVLDTLHISEPGRWM